jgi:hypothetical protein
MENKAQAGMSLEEEVERRLRALNQAKQALATERSWSNEEAYMQCFRWFSLRQIALRLEGENVVLAGPSETREENHGGE